ncbi:MAG: hypothetical protein AB9Q17_02240 [Candidatus Reddybacter sp.]
MSDGHKQAVGESDNSVLLAALRDLRKTTGIRAGGGRLNWYSRGYDKAMLEMRLAINEKISEIKGS